MHVIFVEPRFPVNQARFVHALRAVGAHVTAIGEAPVEALGHELADALVDYHQVPSVCHEESMHDAVRRIQKAGWVDRLECTVEAHTMPVAKVREACGIPGTSTRTAFLCRDKPAMKDALRDVGVPTAQSTGADTVEEAQAFAATVGYPLIVKPRSAAGAAGTYRCDNDEEYLSVLAECNVGKGASVAIEEFIEGHEGFYDTISIDGTPVHEFISHYYPNVLTAMRERWISPQILTTNRVEAAEGYEEVRAMGGKVIDALGIGTSATHMEWFYGPKGLNFSEIGCRPPGVSVWDIYGAANDFDLYYEWAHGVVHGRPSKPASRRFAGGMIALRPDCDGQIVGYEGVDAVRHRLGSALIDMHLPPPGSRTQGVEGGYMANAWLRAKHPDYDTLRELLDFVGETLKVRAR